MVRAESGFWRKTWRAGLVAAAMGAFIVLASWGVIDLQARPRRRALFNDPHEWQIAAFGFIFFFAGLSLILGQKLQAIARFNGMALFVAILGAGSGTVWYANGGRHHQKEGSMNAFLDSFGVWLQSYGVHPVLGAFALGAVIAFVFAYRSAPEPHSADIRAAR